MNRFDFLKKIKFPKVGRISVGGIIVWGIALLLGVGAFLLIQNITACWKLTTLPGLSPASCKQATLNPLGTPVVNEQGTAIVGTIPPTPITAPEVLPPAWDGASRINILFIGLDYRDWQANEGPPRSDTMILFTIDP